MGNRRAAHPSSQGAGADFGALALVVNRREVRRRVDPRLDELERLHRGLRARG